MGPKSPVPVFQKGDLVWAKLRGFPPWPARIDNPPNDKPVPKGKCHVFFFGTHDVATIPAKDVFEFEKFKSKYSGAKKPYFPEAMKEIQETPQITIEDYWAANPEPENDAPIESEQSYFSDETESEDNKSSTEEKKEKTQTPAKKPRPSKPPKSNKKTKAGGISKDDVDSEDEVLSVVTGRSSSLAVSEHASDSEIEEKDIVKKPVKRKPSKATPKEKKPATKKAPRKTPVPKKMNENIDVELSESSDEDGKKPAPLVRPLQIKAPVVVEKKNQQQESSSSEDEAFEPDVPEHNRKSSSSPEAVQTVKQSQQKKSDSDSVESADLQIAKPSRKRASRKEPSSVKKPKRSPPPKKPRTSRRVVQESSSENEKENNARPSRPISIRTAVDSESEVSEKEDDDEPPKKDSPPPPLKVKLIPKSSLGPYVSVPSMDVSVISSKETNTPENRKKAWSDVCSYESKHFPERAYEMKRFGKQMTLWDKSIRSSLNVKNLDIDKCVSTMQTIIDCHLPGEAICTFPELVETIRRCRKFKNSDQVRQIADKLFSKMKTFAQLHLQFTDRSLLSLELKTKLKSVFGQKPEPQPVVPVSKVEPVAQPSIENGGEDEDDNGKVRESPLDEPLDEKVTVAPLEMPPEPTYGDDQLSEAYYSPGRVETIPLPPSMIAAQQAPPEEPASPEEVKDPLTDTLDEDVELDLDDPDNIVVEKSSSNADKRLSELLGSAKSANKSAFGGPVFRSVHHAPSDELTTNNTIDARKTTDRRSDLEDEEEDVYDLLGV